jgi:ABC-type lipoprotein release transport system permease subunit
MFSIVLGLVGGTFTAAFIFGMGEQTINSSVHKVVSHIQIHNPKYLENNETRYFIPDAGKVADDIRKIKAVKSVSERSKVTGMISCASITSGVQILGIDPDVEKTVTTIYQTIADTNGKYFEGVKKNPVLISQKLAEKLNVKVHSKIVLQFPKVDGNIEMAAFRVTGLFKTANTNFDLTNVFVRNNDLADSNGNYFKTHEIAVLLNNIDSTDAVVSQIKAKYPNLSIMTWKEIQPDLALFSGFVIIETYVILGIILFALAFGIVNTMLMVVFERVHELGMLMAIGMNKLRVFTMIMLETVMLTLTGALIGMVLSWILIALVHRNGVDLSAISKGMEAYGIESLIYPSISFGYYLNLTLMVIITGLLASIYPARKALKLNPVEAIREE